MSGGMIGIFVSIPNFESVLRALEATGATFPNATKAIEDATLIVQQTWQSYAMGGSVSYSGGTFVVHPSAEYARSIQRQYPYRGRLGGIVFSNSRIASIIEEGRGPYDMKPGLLRSPRTKVGKKGKRYVTVPFRHGTPGSLNNPMPRNVYDQAKTLNFSAVTGRSLGRIAYQWGGKGGRLPSSPQGQRTKLKMGGMGGHYTWKTGQFSGMVRMNDSATGKSAGYITFRRVSENSDPNSWWHPGHPPKPVTRAVVENTEAQIIRLVRTGFALDLAVAGLPIPTGIR